MDDLAPLPTLRAGGATVVFGDEVLVIGGERSGQGTFSTVEAHDTNTWCTMTSIPTARHGIQAAMFDGNAISPTEGAKMGSGGPTDVQEVLSLALLRPLPLGKPEFLSNRGSSGTTPAKRQVRVGRAPPRRPPQERPRRSCSPWRMTPP